MAYGEDPSVDFNINTPDGSILGEFDDSATQYEHIVWVNINIDG